MSDFPQHSVTRRRIDSAVSVVSWLLLVSLVAGQEAKLEQRPMILSAAPLAIVLEKEAKLVLRGNFLDEITAVKVVSTENITVEVVSKGKTPVPQNYDAKRAGDTLAEIKFSLPKETRAGKLSLTAESAHGVSPVYEIVVLASDELIEEREPNDSFKSPQIISVGKTIVGNIGDARNVDVFRVEFLAGQQVSIETIAARVGSLLDSTLTLYDSKGRIVAANDDHAGTRDSRIDLTVTLAGTYFVTVHDANDAGGLHFAYRLKLTP